MTDAPHIDPRLARVAPTWEVELLISGVAIFAMLQLPGWLDDGMFALEPRLGSEWRLILTLAYFYAKSAAVVLAVTFALHLLLRAHWIALMGMHSVFPQGVRMDKARMGPIQRAIEVERDDRMDDAVERADNRASITFAIGVSVALIIAWVCILFCGALLVATLLSNAIGLGMEPLTLVALVGGMACMPLIVAVTINMLAGERLSPGTPTHRIVSSIIRFYTRMGMGRRNNRILAILQTNQGENRAMLVLVATMLLSIMTVAVMYVAMRMGTSVGSYGEFPAARQLRIEAMHYDDTRSPARDDAVPFIDAMVATGPYLRLNIPYEPRRDGPAMRDCAVPTDADALQEARAQLACLQVSRRVLLDGKPIPALAYEPASDARTQRPALLAMIDIRSLPPGRHELLIARPPAEGSNRDRRDPSYRDYRIPFWK